MVRVNNSKHHMLNEVGGMGWNYSSESRSGGNTENRRVRQRRLKLNEIKCVNFEVKQRIRLRQGLSHEIDFKKFDQTLKNLT
jgi:hypothetical protein